MRRTVNGVLLVYHHPLQADAPTIMEHVGAFEHHSRFRVFSVNTELGFPQSLGELDFTVIVLHYSLFGVDPFMLDEYFRQYVRGSDAYKVAFFQDENNYCRARFAFIDEAGIDLIYTLLEPGYWDEVYRRHTSVRKLVHTLTGYVSDEFVKRAASITVPDDERTIDIGYRTRTLPFYMGRGAREKSELGHRFLERAQGSGLKLDIAVDEESRIYGDAWPRFLANCRGVLGTEAGVSIFDLDDVVRTECERIVAANPEITFEELSEQFLNRYEDRIHYRTVSPRHFEAAALRVCQILYVGKYSGILEPMVHYIPLEKDFSNFDEVLRRFRDPELRRELTENAYRDLIGSGQYSYPRFIESFDEGLVAAGFQPGIDAGLAERVALGLRRDESRLMRGARAWALLRRPFPGRQALAAVVKPPLFFVRDAYRKWKYRRFAKRTTSP